MSWYRVYEIDVLRVGQLFIQQNIDSIYPSAGTVLYTDGSGGTFWSTAGGGGGGGDPSPSSALTQLQLVSTVDGLGQIYTSTSAAGVTGDQLYSTVRNLGTAGYISTAQLQSTVRNLGTAGYISSTQLQSTVRNLGTAGYVSSSQLTSTVTTLLSLAGGAGVSSLFGVVSSGLSTIALFTSNTSNYYAPLLLNNYSTNLQSTVDGLGTIGYISSAQLFSTVTGLSGSAGGEGVSSLFGVVSSGLSTVALFTSNTSNYFLPTLSNNYSTNLQSTVVGLGTAGYISSFTSAAAGVSSLFGVVSSGLSTIALFTSNTSNYFLPTLSNNYSTNLQSTVEGLGTAGYVSTSQLFSTVAGIGTGGGGGLTSNQLISTTEGLGTAGYISTSQLFSTVAGIGTGGGGGISPSQLVSTTEGLGTAGYISTSQLFSTVAGIGTGGGGGITPNQLISTTEGLGTAGYISTSQLLSTSAGLTSNISSMIDPAELTSTVIGLGSAGFLSSVGFTDKLTSTVDGLGTVGYVSSLINVSLVSTLNINVCTINGQTFGAPINSTVIGLGTAGYVSTSQLVAYVSTQINLNPTGTYGELFYLNYSITTGTYKALETAVTGAPLQTVITNINGNVTDDLVAGFQTNSTLPTFIPAGFWTVTLFSRASDTGLSMYSALYSRTTGGAETLIASNTPVTVPTFLTQSQSYLSVPYTNISPGDGLVVKIFVNNSQSSPRSLSNYFESTLYSYVNTTFGTIVPEAGLTSTVRGLGTAGYISSPQLYSTLNTALASTTQGLGTAGYISASQLFSTVFSQQSTLTTALASTAIGLGTLGYISAPQLFSTVFGQQSTLTTALVSTAIGLGTLGYISSSQLYSTLNTALASTTKGLGTAGYISASQLFSTVFAQQSTLATALASTTQGLGIAGYISASQLFSTTRGLENYISTVVTTPGNTTGTVLYFNYSVTATPYNALEYVTTSASATDLSTSLTGNTSNIAVAQFQTDFSLPTFIPAGIWDINLFAYSTDLNNTYVYASLYTRNGGGAETLVTTSAPELITTTVQDQFTVSLAVPYTPILANTTLVVKFFANNTHGPSETLHTLYEGVTYTHMHTTFGTIIPADVFASTVAGLGTAGYISSSQLFSTVAGIGTGGGGGITTAQLTSTAVGLATFGYISSSQLFSTVAGIGTGGGGGGVTSNQLLSTTAGLGTASYASTSTLYNPIIGTAVRFPPINVETILIQDWSTPVSTVALFTSNTSNYYKNALVNFSTPLFSTVAGLGTASYASTTLVYIPNISTQAVLPFPTIGTNPLSTVSAAFGTFSTITATNTYLGGWSTQNAIYFYGLEGTFDRTVLSEQLVSTGTQEFLIFKGSSPSENIRLQASGSLVFETGAAPSIFSSATTQSTPTVLITSSRTVGINCNAPAYTLDISGSANITGTASVGGAASITGATTVSGVLTSRVRVIASTITTDQTLTVADTSTYFFYTTFSPSLNINVPTPVEAGSGWTVTIQNAPASDQVIFVQTTPVQTLSRGDTVRIFTDGLSWYFI